MSVNVVVLNGRIPHFDPVYRAKEGDKESFLMWNLAVKREVKPKDAQYYPEDLIRFKAWGAKADFIVNNFTKGDGIIITGKIQRDDDYEKDGEKKIGEMYVLVGTVSFADGKTSKDDSSSKQATPSAPTVPGAKPATPKPPTIPGGKKLGSAPPKIPGKPPVPFTKK